jgi:hypothetical protein
MKRVRGRHFLRWALVLASVVGGLSTTAGARAESLGVALFIGFGTAVTRVLLDALIPEPVVHVSPPLPEVRAELSDWIDPSTGSTARIERACDQRYVAYLTGTRYSNYLEVKLFNDSDDTVVIAPHSRAFDGMSQHARKLRIVGHSGKYLSYELEKERFYELRQFDVVFELSFANGRTCQTKVEFSRVLPAALSTYRIYSKHDVGFTYGVRLASGSLRDSIGQAGATRGISFGWFPAVQHGIRFEASFDNLDSDRFAFGALLLPAYEFRMFFGSRFSYSFGVGAGAYLLPVRDGVPPSYARGALLLRERMQLKFELPEFSMIQLALGPVVTFGVLPGGPFGWSELTGALYTGSIELSVRM